MLISIIIPTYNEQEQIYKLLDSIQAQQKDNIEEVIIVDSPLSIHKIVLKKQYAKVRVVISPKAGRAQQMNYGANLAKGKVLQFIHADAIMPTQFDQRMVETISKGIDAGCFSYQFDSDSFLLKINAAFTHLPFIWCRGGDQAIFVKKEVFEKLNGFNEKMCIMEDYEFLRRLFSKHTFKIIHQSIIVSSRKYQKNSWLKVQRANFIVMRNFLSGHFDPLKMKAFYQKTLKN